MAVWWDSAYSIGAKNGRLVTGPVMPFDDRFRYLPTKKDSTHIHPRCRISPLRTHDCRTYVSEVSLVKPGASVPFSKFDDISKLL